MSDRFSCARASLVRTEPQYATASHVRRWIALEQPGPWGRDAVLQSRIPRAAAVAFRRRARALRARIILIRRHAASRQPATRTCLVAVSGPGRGWVEELTLDAPTQLLDIDLRPLLTGDPVGGRPLEGSPYLVCTNGRHDVCCAEFGRPLAATLTGLRPEATWECSHIGGDRFAGNLVVLREGLYFGRVGPDEAQEVVEAYERGELSLAHYRGRSCYPFHVQAGEHLLRLREGLAGIGDLALVARRQRHAGLHELTFTRPDGHRYVVQLAVRADPEGRPLTCRAAVPARPPRYELLGVTQLPPIRPGRRHP